MRNYKIPDILGGIRGFFTLPFPNLIQKINDVEMDNPVSTHIY